jgi:hypothetical protein
MFGARPPKRFIKESRQVQTGSAVSSLAHKGHHLNVLTKAKAQQRLG